MENEIENRGIPFSVFRGRKRGMENELHSVYRSLALIVFADKSE